LTQTLFAAKEQEEEELKKLKNENEAFKKEVADLKKSLADAIAQMELCKQGLFHPPPPLSPARLCLSLSASLLRAKKKSHTPPSTPLSKV
jgi:hypothetical protein